MEVCVSIRTVNTLENCARITRRDFAAENTLQLSGANGNHGANVLKPAAVVFNTPLENAKINQEIPKKHVLAIGLIKSMVKIGIYFIRNELDHVTKKIVEVNFALNLGRFCLFLPTFSISRSIFSSILNDQCYNSC